jgi:serine/threonine protein kinase
MRRQLGSGKFSRVFECDRVHSDWDQEPPQKQKYAVKVIRNERSYRRQAMDELEILKVITESDTNGDSCCIHLIDCDSFLGHPIFVFPLMARSIRSFMEQNNDLPFSYDDAIDLLEQICRGVAFVHSLDIIITDLKPENIVFVDDRVDLQNPNSRSFSSPRSTAIKLIDFGSAVVCPPGMVHSHLIQTRHYRAPEVVLNMEWDQSADVWSIGCVLVELIYGKLLFQTRWSLDHFHQMISCLGVPPQAMLNNIGRRARSTFFHQNGSIKHQVEGQKSPFQCSALRNYFNFNDLKGVQLFDLCSKMLCWDPMQRITASQALQHPLFKLQRRCRR